MPPIDTSPRTWADLIPALHRPPLRWWFWSVAAATLAVIVIGGTTRLTYSGLSIVDWDPIIGVVPPLSHAQWLEAFARYQQFPEYQTRAGMTLSEFKSIFFWEYLHRLAARGIGFVFIVPLILFWLRGYLVRPLAVRAVALFGLGLLQGVVGWLMVKSGLVDRPSVSHFRLALHLSLALGILAYAVTLARDLSAPRPATTVSRESRSRAMRAVTALGVLLGLQIVWGAFVAGLKAGFFLNTFPLMAGGILPPGALSLDPAALNVLQNPVAVQWLHRALGTVLLLASILVLVLLRRTGADRTNVRLAAVFAAVMTVQYAVGAVTLVLAVPVPLGVLHQAIAAFLVALWAVWRHHAAALRVSQSRPGAASADVPSAGRSAGEAPSLETSKHPGSSSPVRTV